MSVVLPSTSLSPAWSSSTPPGRRNLMPNNMLASRTGHQRGFRNDYSDKMPTVTSRRVIPKNQDLSPSPGLPRKTVFSKGASSTNGFHSNNSTGNLNHMGSTTNAPITSRQSSKQAAYSTSSNLHGNGMMIDKHGKFPQFDELRNDTFHTKQDEYNAHIDTKVSTPPNHSKSSFHNPSPINNVRTRSSEHSSQKQESNSPGSSRSMTYKLKEKEEITEPYDPRVKLDPKLTLGSHSHVTSSIPSDDRVQLRIAVEELRLIVKWREQQQQELQKRVGKLAGKYNKLLDLYISEKDRAESAFAKLQKQLRELRTKDKESTKLFHEKDLEISKKNIEINNLKDLLELEKRRYEQDTHRLTNQVDSLSSKLKTQAKEMKARENAGVSISQLTDSELCRWQSYDSDNSNVRNYNSSDISMDSRNENIFQPVRPPRIPTRRSSIVGRRKSTKKIVTQLNRSSTRREKRGMEDVGDEEDVKRRNEEHIHLTDSDLGEEEGDSEYDEEEEYTKKGCVLESTNGESNHQENKNNKGTNVKTALTVSRCNSSSLNEQRLSDHTVHEPSPPTSNKLLDQMSLQVEVIKCELLWSQKQVISLQKKLCLSEAKSNQKIVVDEV